MSFFFLCILISCVLVHNFSICLLFIVHWHSHYIVVHYYILASSLSCHSLSFSCFLLLFFFRVFTIHPNCQPMCIFLIYYIYLFSFSFVDLLSFILAGVYFNICFQSPVMLAILLFYVLIFQYVLMNETMMVSS